MEVSVIIPIYNVETYIARCVKSLMEQTLQGVEYIFVDDCSQDGSMTKLNETLSDYPLISTNVKIVAHKQNKGLPAARNTGMDVATGDYIFHCDSDDFLEPDALAQLYKAAIENGSDYVWCDWFLSFEKNERYMKQPSYTTVEGALKGVLSGTMKYNVWNKLVKKSLYDENDIRFPEGHGMGEDMTMIRLLACAGQVSYVHYAGYHYVKSNADAFTQTYSLKNLEGLRYNVDETVGFLREKVKHLPEQYFAFFLLHVKLPFLIGDNWKMYRLWEEWYPEANAYILANKQVTLRTRLLQYAASKGCFLVVWAYYKLVYKFIYGIVYK